MVILAVVSGLDDEHFLIAEHAIWHCAITQMLKENMTPFHSLLFKASESNCIYVHNNFSTSRHAGHHIVSFAWFFDSFGSFWPGQIGDGLGCDGSFPGPP